MKTTAQTIIEIKGKIKKLESDFKRGVPPYQGFTIDISYGGNNCPDIERVSIGSISDEKDVSDIFYNIVLTSLKNSLKFWENVAKREIEELYESLKK